MNDLSNPAGDDTAPGDDGAETQDELAQIEAENAQLKADLKTAMDRGRTRRVIRSVLVWLLVVITSISIVATTAGFWIRSTVFDTDNYVALVGPVAADPEVQQAAATRLTDELFTALDVQNRVAAQLPEQLVAFAPAITGQVHDFIHDRVLQFVQSDAFQTFWVAANRTAHQKIVALLQGDLEKLPNVVIQSGEVRISLIGAAVRVLQQLATDLSGLLPFAVSIPDFPGAEDPQAAIARLSSILGRPLPEDFGQITIMTVDQLESLQSLTDTVERLPWLLLVVTILLAGIAVAVAPNRRRVLIGLGIGAVVALVLTLRLIGKVQDNLTEQIANPGARAAARDLVSTVLNSLRSLAIWVVVGGALVAVASYLAGRPRWLSAAGAKVGRAAERTDGGPSKLEAWTAAHADAARVVGILVAALVLFLWGVSLLSIVVVGALLALFLWGVAAAQSRSPAGVPAAPS